MIGATFLSETEFPATIMQKMIEEAKHRNIELIAYNARSSLEEQMKNMQDLIDQHVDVIILNPVEASGGVRCVEMAVEAGIPILGVNAVVNTDQLWTYVGMNDLEAGEIEMKYIAEELKGEGNIVIINGIMNQSSQIQRTQGILNVLRGYPKINILDVQPGNWSRTEGYDLMKEWIAKYGDEISAVVSQNDEMALGAIQYLEEQNLLGTIPVIGIDAIPDGLAAIEKGKLDASVYQDADGQAKLALDLAIRIFHNETIAKTYFIPFSLVTKHNVRQFTPSS